MKLIFFQPLQDKRVVVGQNVLLECQVAGYPDPVVKWLKDDHDVTQCPDYAVSSINILLIFISNFISFSIFMFFLKKKQNIWIFNFHDYKKYLLFET